MNVMVKDATIEKLAIAVRQALDLRQLQIVDYWDADLFAIGFVRRDEPNRLLYVTSFDQPQGEYTAIQERRGDTEQWNSTPFTNLAVDDVIAMMVEYLRLSRTIAPEET